MQVHDNIYDSPVNRQTGAVKDREHLRQARALEARWRWESLLEDLPLPAPVSSPVHAQQGHREDSQARCATAIHSDTQRYTALVL